METFAKAIDNISPEKVHTTLPLRETDGKMDDFLKGKGDSLFPIEEGGTRYLGERAIPPEGGNALPFPEYKGPDTGRTPTTFPSWETDDKMGDFLKGREDSLFSLGEKSFRPTNEKLEGTNHPETGVPYRRIEVTLSSGEVVSIVCPDFSEHCIATVQLDKNENGDYCDIRKKHEENANKKLKEDFDQNPDKYPHLTDEQKEQIRDGQTPDGYTWHHSEQEGRMELVDSSVHGKSGHTGGYAVWGERSNVEVSNV